jgi:hypothetical protein
MGEDIKMDKHERGLYNVENIPEQRKNGSQKIRVVIVSMDMRFL